MKHFRTATTALVLVIFILYFVLNIDKFKPLLNLNYYLLIAIAAADLLMIAANGVFIKVVMEPFEKYIPLAESIYVSTISSVGNFFAPAGSGFGFRAVYLKKKHGLSYSNFIATLYGNYLIIFLVNSFFALLALYLLRNSGGRGYFVLVVLFSAMFVFSLLLSLVRLPLVQKETSGRNRHLNSITKALTNMVSGWNRIITDKKLLRRLILITAFNFLMSLAVAKLEINALHFTVSFPALILFSVLGSLSLFVNITPANLGVKEAIYLFSSSVIGLSAPQILSVALIDRGVLFTILFMLWLLLARGKKVHQVQP